MKKWEVRLNQIGGKGGPQTVILEGNNHNDVKRHAEQLYGRGNVTNVQPKKN